MPKIICTCGHENPEGTHLCANCGRPLQQEDIEQKVVDMRYEGTAIRSKTYKKSIVDKIWNFFSSVKIGVTLIVCTLVAAAIGTFLPQVVYVTIETNENPADVYAREYGTFGKLYYALGLSDIYSSWWFQLLVGLLAISIIVASLDRGLPLYKSLKNQRTKRHESFMKRQRVIGEEQMTEQQMAYAFEKTVEKMKKKNYKVRVEDDALLAEKGRFARWGPYVNHLGLIIFLTGVMLRLFPGFYVDETMWIREGETTSIPGMEGYYLHSNQFLLETYADDEKSVAYKEAKEAVNVVAKNYQTDVTLYKESSDSTFVAGNTDNLKEVKTASIQVNKALKYDGYALYQMDFRIGELKTMTFELQKKQDEKAIGTVTIDLNNPKTEYEIANGTKVVLKEYFPDFNGFKDGEPQTASPTPNNPAFIFNMITPETPKGETSFVAIQQTLEPLGETQYKMKFKNVETRNASGLVVRKDATLPILIVGGVIFMIGVTMGSYWSHRRLWLQKTTDGRLLLAAHTNKNWFSMKKDLREVVHYAELPDFIDQQDLEQGEDNKRKGEDDV